MSFLDEVLQADAPTPREVNFGGKVGTVWFKRITAAQRVQILKGQRVQAAAGKTSVDIDLGDNETTKLMFVQFCVCHEDGKPYFANLDKVKALESSKVEVLYSHATAVNSPGEEPGES